MQTIIHKVSFTLFFSCYVFIYFIFLSFIKNKLAWPEKDWHNQIHILYCLTLDFLAVSGNTITLLEPPEDDPVSTLYSSHWLGMFFEILMQVLSIHICVWQGEGTSAAAECTFADDETVSLDSRRL